jgi:hypothetical protein
MRAWLKCVGGLAAMTIASTALAADHRDAPNINATLGGDPAADINDVYAWVEGDDLILTMTLFPVADATSAFSSEVQYAFHLNSASSFGTTGTPTDIICEFDAAQVASCWVGTVDYVTGDASITEGISSAVGTKVFAGLRGDPFFFNLEGFNDTVSTVIAAAPTLAFDTAGCPTLDANTSTTLVNMLKSTQAGAGAPADFFGPLNTLSIVVSVPRALVTGDGENLISVWASTHQKM